MRSRVVGSPVTDDEEVDPTAGADGRARVAHSGGGDRGGSHRAMREAVNGERKEGKRLRRMRNGRKGKSEVVTVASAGRSVACGLSRWPTRPSGRDRTAETPDRRPARGHTIRSKPSSIAPPLTAPSQATSSSTRSYNLTTWPRKRTCCRLHRWLALRLDCRPPGPLATPPSQSKPAGS